MNEFEGARETMRWCGGELNLLIAWIHAASSRGDRDEVERLMNRYDELMLARRQASKVCEGEVTHG